RTTAEGRLRPLSQGERARACGHLRFECQTAKGAHPHSRGAIAPECVMRTALEDEEGAGNARRLSTHSLMCEWKKAHELVHHRSSQTSAFPAQWRTAYLRALPGVHDLV